MLGSRAASRITSVAMFVSVPAGGGERVCERTRQSMCVRANGREAVEGREGTSV